jgi:predicted TIM-barrel fold metal-dependent hydrolase
MVLHGCTSTASSSILMHSEGSVFMGSDYPFPIGDPSPVDVVEKADCLSESQRRAIAGTSAAELFNLTDTGG